MNKEIENIIDKDINLLANTKLNENTSKDAITYLVVENAKLIKENQQLKKQKADVIEYIKKNILISYDKYGFDKNIVAGIIVNDLLRMLGEIDE